MALQRADSMNIQKYEEMAYIVIGQGVFGFFTNHVKKGIKTKAPEHGRMSAPSRIPESICNTFSIAGGVGKSACLQICAVIMKSPQSCRQRSSSTLPCRVTLGSTSKNQ